MTLAGYEHLIDAAARLQWDEAAIDLRGDARAWPGLDAAARGRITTLIAGFCVAERAVAEHLEPFGAAAADAVARAAFAAQAVDEARHARFFTRVAREVVGFDPDRDAAALAGAEIVVLFTDGLPALAARLAGGDASLSEAVAYYHLVLEGIVFAIGQAALQAELGAAGLHGTLKGVRRVQADERWHIGLGAMALQDRGDAPAVGQLAARAAAAWGPDVATPDRVEDVLRVHRRRVGLLTRAVA